MMLEKLQVQHTVPALQYRHSIAQSVKHLDKIERPCAHRKVRVHFALLQSLLCSTICSAPPTQTPPITSHPNTADSRHRTGKKQSRAGSKKQSNARSKARSSARQGLDPWAATQCHLVCIFYCNMLGACFLV